MARTTLAAPSRPRPVSRGARYPKGAAPPVLVEMRRGGIVESRHRGQIAQVGIDGRLERVCGDPETLVTLRSCVKPFGLIPLLESGAAQAFAITDPELAVMAASHSGEDLHVRTLQAVFRRAGLSQALLRCGTEEAPLDPMTAARLARDGEAPGPIRHMCSGFHAASILLSRHAGWPVEDYDRADHPSQVAIRGAVARVFGVAARALPSAIDSCGLPTYAVPLLEVARAFAFLADPAGAEPVGPRAEVVPHLTRIRDAMLAAPDMVGGTRDRLDTALMRARPGLFAVKGGAEALRGVALLAGARGPRSPAAGLAVKIDDGDQTDRALRAATIEALVQLGALDDQQQRGLAAHHRPAVFAPNGELIGEAVAGFQLAPFSELA